MSDALSFAINGLNSSVARATQFTRDIVNASSTGKNVEGGLVGLQGAKTDYAANATVIKTVQKEQKALLDIKV